MKQKYATIFIAVLLLGFFAFPFAMQASAAHQGLLPPLLSAPDQTKKDQKQTDKKQATPTPTPDPALMKKQFEQGAKQLKKQAESQADRQNSGLKRVDTP